MERVPRQKTPKKEIFKFFGVRMQINFYIKIYLSKDGSNWIF